MRICFYEVFQRRKDTGKALWVSKLWLWTVIWESMATTWWCVWGQGLNLMTSKSLQFTQYHFTTISQTAEENVVMLSFIITKRKKQIILPTMLWDGERYYLITIRILTIVMWLNHITIKVIKLRKTQYMNVFR